MITHASSKDPCQNFLSSPSQEALGLSHHALGQCSLLHRSPSQEGLGLWQHTPGLCNCGTAAHGIKRLTRPAPSRIWCTPGDLAHTKMRL
eukprot:366496-Chlamydomonas_euryale.AAC.21